MFIFDYENRKEEIKLKKKILKNTSPEYDPADLLNEMNAERDTLFGQFRKSTNF